jgi:hypothetical protein
MLDHPFNAAALLDAAIERAQALPVVDGPDSAPEDDEIAFGDAGDDAADFRVASPVADDIAV